MVKEKSTLAGRAWNFMQPPSACFRCLGNVGNRSEGAPMKSESGQKCSLATAFALGVVHWGQQQRSYLEEIIFLLFFHLYLPNYLTYTTALNPPPPPLHVWVVVMVEWMLLNINHYYVNVCFHGRRSQWEEADLPNCCSPKIAREQLCTSSMRTHSHMLAARRELTYSVTGHQGRLCRCVPLTGSSNSGCLISCSYFTLSHVTFFAVQHTQNTIGYVWKCVCMSLCLSCVQPAFTGYLTCVSKASSLVLCNVDRILISCFADCEVSVNKHRQLALTGDIE